MTCNKCLLLGLPRVDPGLGLLGTTLGGVGRGATCTRRTLPRVYPLLRVRGVGRGVASTSLGGGRLGGVERALEGSFELENSDDDEVVDAIEESVDDLEVSVVSIEVDGRVSGSVKSGGGSSMRGNFSVDYEDVGMGSTPPTSAAGDDAAFDVERGGVSLDDEDFEVDHDDVW